MGYPIFTREICNVLNVNKLENERFFHKLLIINFIRKTTGDDKIPHLNKFVHSRKIKL